MHLEWKVGRAPAFGHRERADEIAAGEDGAALKRILPLRISEGADPPRFSPEPTCHVFGSNLVANC